MSDDWVKPFRALRPRPATAASVVAPPYDVVSFDEALALASGRPDSFLHISRPEIDLPPGTDPYADEVYARGAANLQRLRDRGVLVRDDEACFYIYRMTMGSHRQTGVALAASVDAYDGNRVRKHERTRPDKEDDRVRNITALNAQTGPVLCAHRSSETLRALLAAHSATEPLIDVEGPNAVRHAIWQLSAPDRVAELGDALNALDALYIADGHHRSAAAARVAAERRASGEPLGYADHFVCVAFPQDELKILDYNRIVKDLRGHSVSALIDLIRGRFGVTPLDRPSKPGRRNEFTMYLDRHWYRLSIDPAAVPQDPVGRLDVSLLQDQLLGPLLGVGDPRTDARIAFVGGIHGLDGLVRRVDSGDAAVAFALYPTAMEQLMAVADAELLMPPKSTWFEPKLADGLLSQLLD